MALKININNDDYNSHSIINDVSINCDLLVFPDGTILAWDEYDPITYAHLGEQHRAIKAGDDDYLSALLLYNNQHTQN